MPADHLSVAPTANERKRLLALLAASVLLHLFILTVVVPRQPAHGPAVAPLDVQLHRSKQLPEPSPALPVPAAGTDHRPIRATPPSAPSEAAPPSTVSAPLPPSIDLEAVRATVRRYAREPGQRQPEPREARPLTVEAAVARAAEPDQVVEKRGAAGEYVTESKNFRCVQALVKPHYLDGMNPPPLCQRR